MRIALKICMCHLSLELHLGSQCAGHSGVPMRGPWCVPRSRGAPPCPHDACMCLDKVARISFPFSIHFIIRFDIVGCPLVIIMYMTNHLAGGPPAKLSV